MILKVNNAVNNAMEGVFLTLELLKTKPNKLDTFWLFLYAGIPVTIWKLLKGVERLFI